MTFIHLLASERERKNKRKEERKASAAAIDIPHRHFVSISLYSLCTVLGQLFSEILGRN
jgi:hypothetical protein